MQKDKNNLVDINITQALVYPFYQENLKKTIGLPGLAAFTGSLLLMVGILFFSLLVQFIANKTWGLNVDVNYMMRLLLIMIFCAFYLPCLLGYGWKLLDILRREGLDAQAPDATLEERVIEIWFPDDAVRYDTDTYDTYGWKGIRSLWWDGCKLASCILMFIMFTIAIFSFIAPAAVRFMNIGTSDSLLVMISIASIASWLCVPFFIAAPVQSAETRHIRDLFNIHRTVKAGIKCYGKCLIVSLLLVIVFAIYIGVFVAVLIQFFPDLMKVKDLMLFFVFPAYLILPAYVAGLFTSFHLIAQAFNNYREGNLSSEQKSVQITMTQSKMSIGWHNLLMVVGVATAALPFLWLMLTHHESIRWVLLLLPVSAIGVIMIGFQVSWRGKQKDLKEMQDLHKTISRDPKNVKAYKRRAELYFEQKQYQKAINDFSEIIRLEPDKDKSNLAFFYGERGTAYLALEQYKQAGDDYSEAFRLDSTSWSSWYKPGPGDSFTNTGQGFMHAQETHYQAGHYEKAIDHFTKAINQDPLYIRAYVGRALVYRMIEQDKKAKDDFTTAIKLKVRYNRDDLWQGVAFANLGQHRKAIHSYNKQIKFLQESDAAKLTYLRRGDAYHALGQDQQAIEDYCKITGGDAERTHEFALHRWKSMGKAILNYFNYMPDEVQSVQSSNSNESGENKKCPLCGESIKPQAIRCKHCHANLTNLVGKQAGLAAVLSVFIVGLGQIYNGQIGIGLAALFLWGFSLMVLLTLLHPHGADYSGFLPLAFGIISLIVLLSVYLTGIWDSYRNSRERNRPFTVAVRIGYLAWVGLILVACYYSWQQNQSNNQPVQQAQTQQTPPQTPADQQVQSIIDSYNNPGAAAQPAQEAPQQNPPLDTGEMSQTDMQHILELNKIQTTPGAQQVQSSNTSGLDPEAAKLVSPSHPAPTTDVGSSDELLNRNEYTNKPGVYNDDNVKITFNLNADIKFKLNAVNDSAATAKGSLDSELERSIFVSVTNTSQTKIVHFWPSMITVCDNYGNAYQTENPQHIDQSDPSYSRGLYPGETSLWKIRFHGKLISTADSMVLSVSKNDFGNDRSFDAGIPLKSGSSTPYIKYR